MQASAIFLLENFVNFVYGLNVHATPLKIFKETPLGEK